MEIYKADSLQMETKQIQVDEKCCRMKSISGHCPKPLESFSSYLSKKWSISIIMTIGNFEKLRFNDLLDRLENAKAKILSLRLKELENSGIIERFSYNEKPPRVEYSLTKKGKSLLKSLTPLIEWSERQ
jgi:DNA-binding HxlR family transcriptional regulator